MSTNKSRLLVIIEPEMEAPLDQLKKDIFYNQSKAAMIRHLLAEGIKSVEREQAEKKD